MGRYLFQFGFERPEQRRANELHGWDDEDSCAFYVIAPSPDDALTLGCATAELLVARLFEANGWPNPVPSWREGNFAYWIEDDPPGAFSLAQLKDLPVVTEGGPITFSL